MPNLLHEILVYIITLNTYIKPTYKTNTYLLYSRLSRPSLVTQHPLQAPFTSSTHNHDTATAPMPASLAYGSSSTTSTDTAAKNTTTNPTPFLLAPILNLPPSFGSAYVGETFSCTLCANHDIPPDPVVGAGITSPGGGGGGQLTAAAAIAQQQQQKKKFIRDVRIEAEMKTPGSGGTVQKLVLGPHSSSQNLGDVDAGEGGGGGSSDGTDLEPNQTLQRIVNFDLKEEGNHVLAVTVSYYEATETSGRTRTFRKLYQFICKGSLIVRTKVSPLPSFFSSSSAGDGDVVVPAGKGGKKGKKKLPPPPLRKKGRSWAMEAQLENCSEDVMQLERVGLDLEAGLRYADCNYWGSSSAGAATKKPVLHPGEVEQCCFVVEEEAEDAAAVTDVDRDGGRIVFGVLGIGWRSEMGNKGFLSTGKLGTRVATTAAVP